MRMNSDLAIAQARLSTPITLNIGRELPANIQYMPPSVQTIAPSVNGEPMDMTIVVTAKYADVFDRAAQAMIAAARAGQGDMPFGDFNHEDSAASVRPTRFWWGGDDLVTGGVRMDSPWTGTGAASLRNGEFVRWSPQWVFHKTTLEPLGLPVNVGGLVNRAAFKTIAPVVSAKGEEAWFAGILATGCRAGSGGLPGDGILAAARELRQRAPERFPSNADALEAYLRTAAGAQEYMRFVGQMRSGQR